jgi:molecular chaperone HscB
VADKNYFELFGLSPHFELDIAQLTSRYRELAREAHPDRFARGSDSERRLAVQMTTLLNEAFRVLKQPISRARYLLELQGATHGPDAVAAVDPAFLLEQMTLRERLDEARGHVGDLAALREDVARAIREREAMLRQQLTPGASQPAPALRTVQEMQFLDKLRQQIADLEEASHP